MPPILRNQVSSFLGWTIFTQPSFGDTHAEAWDIISRNHSGMQARCNTTTETLNVLGSNTDWYDMLTRVGKNTLQTDLSKHISGKMLSEALRNSKDRFIPDIEEEFLIHLNQLIISNMTPSQKEELIQGAESKEVEAMRNIFMKNAGIKSKDVAQYGYKLTNKILQPAGMLKTMILTESSKWIAMSGSATLNTVSASVAPLLVPITAAAAMLATPLFVIGLFGLALKGVKLAFGSSEGRVIVPVVTILNQRLLLALEDVNIDQYY